MSGDLVQMPGTAMAGGPNEPDNNALFEWLRGELMPERPEGEINRVTLHRADHQGHMKARIKTVPIVGKPADERLQDMASELIVAAERDARGPCGAPIYVAKVWTAAGAESVGEHDFVPSQAGPRFDTISTSQAQTALLGQVYGFNGELMRRSVAMMVAQTAFADRQIERMEAETRLLREQAKQQAIELEDARQRNHERRLEAERQAAELQRGKEIFDLVRGGVDMVAARWSPAGTATSTVIAGKVVEFVDGLSPETRAQVLAAFAPDFRAKFDAIVEAARNETGDKALGKRLVLFFDAVPDDQRARMFAHLSGPEQMRVGAIAELAAKAANVDVSDADAAEGGK